MKFNIRKYIFYPAFVALIISCGGSSFGAGEQPPVYTRPAENILIIVADIQRHVNDDVYRFQYPTDVTGQNVFRACLVRLANYEKLYPGKLADVVALAKAQAFERLCSFKEAGENYQQAQKSSDATIARVAGEGFERCKRFSLAADQDIDTSALRLYEKDMQKKIRDLDALATEFKGTPYQSLAQTVLERTQMQMAEFYVSMRFMRPYTTDDALMEIKHNIDKNKDSKLLYAHHMMLGDLYYDLAKEYTLLNSPEGANFDMKEFKRFASPARAEYHIIEQADGFPEKLEGRAKLLALEAFVDRVTERSR